MLLIEFQTGNFEQIILGKAFMTNTYTTFFLERRELQVAQPKIEKYKDLVKKKDHKIHGAALQKKTSFQVWDQQKLAHLAQIAEKEHS